MLNTYCQHCGTKIEYRFQKPNFCTSCGQPLHGEARDQSSIPTQNNATKVTQASMEIHDEDGTDVFEVPRISRLDYEIEVSTSSFSMGDLFKHEHSEVVPDSPKPRGRPRKSNGKTKKD